jgi:hypothetical protein
MSMRVPFAALFLLIVLTACTTEQEPAEKTGFESDPLPSVFYKNHTNDTREARDSVDSALTLQPESIALPTTDTSDQLFTVYALNSSVNTSSSDRIVRPTTTSSSSGGSSRRRSSGEEATTPPQTNTTNQTTTNQTNSTPPTNTTPPINVTPINTTNTTNTTRPITNQTNQTNSTPPTNTTKPPLNTTVNITRTTTLSVLAPFPQDWNVVFVCTNNFNATEYEWTVGKEKPVKTTKNQLFYTLPDDGSYAVQCVAKNKDGKATSPLKTVTVSSPIPLQEDYPYAALIDVDGSGDTYTFTCEDAGYTAETFTWRISGGEYATSTPGVNFFEGADKTLTHTFPGEGTYQVYCEAITYDDTYSKAYYETGQLCNSARGCIVSSAEEMVTVANDTEQAPITTILQQGRMAISENVLGDLTD